MKGWLITICGLILVLVVRYVFAAPVPDIKCNTGNMMNDYECMRENWRPKKQVSYDTAKTYCDSKGEHLQGQGEIMLWVDDTPYNFRIDCK